MWLVVFLWFALALNYIDRQMVYSIFPALKADLHFTDVQLALTGSIFAWVYALCMPIAGHLSDRLRRDRMIVAGMALWSAATLGCGLSHSVFMFLLWRAVMGITESLYYPAAVSTLAAAHTGATRSKAMGIHQSAQMAGIVAGGSYGGWMADHAGWRVGFVLAAGAGILYSIILSKKLPISQAPPMPMQGHPVRTSLRLFRSPCYMALSAAFFAFCAMLWIFYAWFPTFLFERFHLSMTESGFRATLFVQLSCGAGIVVGGALADRLSKRIPAARFYIAASRDPALGTVRLSDVRRAFADLGYRLFLGLRCVLRPHGGKRICRSLRHCRTWQLWAGRRVAKYGGRHGRHHHDLSGRSVERFNGIRGVARMGSLGMWARRVASDGYCCLPFYQGEPLIVGFRLSQNTNPCGADFRGDEW